MRLKEVFLVLSVIVLLLFLLGDVSAFEFNGTVRSLNGNALNNSLINITIRSSAGFSVVGYNFTSTNESGWFNLSVDENVAWMYEPKITWKNSSSGAIELIGQSLPSFPSEMVQQVAGTTFYLKPAGTINITAINSTGGKVAFNYQIKDQKLGYSVAADFSNKVNEAVITVPRDRNYSLMIYPNQSMPVSFNWNNLSSAGSYNISNISSYNFTTKTLHYKFNTTITLKRFSGYINYSAISGWNEFVVLPYLLEPGNMVHVEYGLLPYNISSGSSSTDIYNLTNGFYNISLPGTVETSAVLLFASAVNGTQNIGFVRNVSLSTSSSAETIQLNFTNGAGLFGAFSNVSPTSLGGAPRNFTLSKQNFTILNSTNSTMSTVNGHIEVTVDYSSIGAIEFTWMTDISQGSSSSFLVPLLNNTGIKELNAFLSGGNFAPVRKSYSPSQLANGVNITLNSFNPNAINSALAASSISMGLYISNSSCDVPNPENSCIVGSSTSMNDFNPMKAIMGGGALSFRMGTGSISVHYVNVDMLASGPPDALFDDTTTDAAGSASFSSAVRFGSGGPTIYDYVLISLPYTEGSSSVTGLNETNQINMSIPLFYDENWNVIWNVSNSNNGSNPGAFAGNYSHYSAKQSDWAYIMNNSACHTDAAAINVSQPCYINTTSNRIWIRLPHFSGTGPSITGGVITAVSSTTSSSGSSGGGTSTSSFWTKTVKRNEIEFSEKKEILEELKEKERVNIKIDGKEHYVGVISIKASDRITINVSSTPQQAVIFLGEPYKFEITDDNFYDLSVLLNGVNYSKANLTISYIQEKILNETEKKDLEKTVEEEKGFFKEGEISAGKIVIAFIIAIVIIILIVAYLRYYKKK